MNLITSLSGDPRQLTHTAIMVPKQLQSPRSLNQQDSLIYGSISLEDSLAF